MKQFFFLSGMLMLTLFTVTQTQADTRSASGSSLSLSQALEKVLQNDFQLTRNNLEAHAFAAEAESRNVLPDPVLFAGMQSIPTDTFDLDQEAMTQLRFGITQMFPKGASLSLNQSILQHAQAEQRLRLQETARKLRQQTEQAWLEAWYWQKSIQLIEEDRTFLTQMLDFMQSIYQLGGNTQSDLLGAKLELIRLEEKRLEADRQYQIFRHELNALANEFFSQSSLSPVLVQLAYLPLPSRDELAEKLSTHPAFLILDESIAQMHKKTSLSEQEFEPQWGVELSYGLRQDMPDGTDRADFFSAGVSVQLPLFSRPQKSSAVRATRLKQAAIENRRLELFEKVHFELENLSRQYRSTLAQRELYEEQILPMLSKQKDSAMQSYESDKGDFRVVTDLYLKEQSTRLKLQRLRVNEQQLLSKMNYWLADEVVIPTSTQRQTNATKHSVQQEMQP
jgi:outer membrane protein TolC